MRINTNGNVLIGTTTDAGYKLDVNGTGRFTGNLTANAIILGAGLANGMRYDASNVIYNNTSYGWVIYGWSYNHLTATNGLLISNSTSTTKSSNSFVSVIGSTTASGSLGQGVYFNNTLVAAANNDVLVGLDINPTFTNGAFTGVSNYALRLGNSVGVSTNNAYTLNYIIFNALTANQGISAGFVPNGTPTGYGYNFQFGKSSTANNNSLLIIGGGSAALGNSANKHVISTSADGTATGQPLVLRVAPTGISWSVLNDHFTIFPTGNVVIQNSSSSATDAGYKLDVNGSTAVRGILYVTDTAGTPRAALQGYDNNEIQLSASRWVNGSTATLDSNGLNINTGTYAVITGVLGVSTSNINTSMQPGRYGFTGRLIGSSSILSGGSTWAIKASAEVNITDGTTSPGTVFGVLIDPTLGTLNNVTYVALRSTVGNVQLNTTSGNTLIGTTTDAGQKLQVLGNAKFSSAVDTYHYITSTATGSAGTIYTNTYHSFFTGTNYATANSWEVYDLTSSASRIHISGPTGNVAINQTYAVYKLDVAGDIRSTTSAYLATTSGFVGIGTTTPASKLDVVGDVNVSGVFAVGGVGGWTGTITIMTNPPGQQNIHVTGGIITGFD
jgi:hypothetical protein